MAHHRGPVAGGRGRPPAGLPRAGAHRLRHTAATQMQGVDIATIAPWLGHESTQTTHIYQHADAALKEQAIARTTPLGVKPGRYL
jgi:integrase/recombinase XerD